MGETLSVAAFQVSVGLFDMLLFIAVEAEATIASGVRRDPGHVGSCLLTGDGIDKLPRFALRYRLRNFDQ